MLTRLAVQLCAVQALKSKTLVGNLVRDSHVGVIQLDADGNPTTSEQKPFINIFCEDTEVAEENASLLGPQGQLQVFQFGVTSAMLLVTADGQYCIDPNTGEVYVEPRSRPSDPDINVLIDIIERQIRGALSDPENEWAELWRRFWLRLDKIGSNRGQSQRDSVRFGARELSITGQLLAEPPYGATVQPGSVWQAFLDALPGSEIETMAEDFESLLGSGDPQADHEVLQRRFTHTIGAARGLGYGFDATRDSSVPIAGSLVSKEE